MGVANHSGKDEAIGSGEVPPGGSVRAVVGQGEKRRHRRQAVRPGGCERPEDTGSWKI